MFKDDYETALKKLVQRKAAGKTIAAPAPAAQPSNVINLMDALRRSLEGGKRGGNAPASRRPRRGATRRRPRKAA
jgi:DNA end-binding protein Ku